MHKSFRKLFVLRLLLVECLHFEYALGLNLLVYLSYDFVNILAGRSNISGTCSGRGHWVSGVGKHLQAILQISELGKHEHTHLLHVVHLNLASVDKTTPRKTELNYNPSA
jgi:hypothetical protein